MNALFQADAATTAKIREAYARLGGAITAQLSLTARTAEVETLRAEVERQGSAAAARTADVETLRAEVERQGSAAAARTAEVETLRAEVERQGSAAAARTAEVETLRAEVERQGSAAAARAAEAEELQQRARALTVKRDAASEEAARLRTQSASLATKVDAAIKEIGRLRVELAEQSARLSRAKQKLRTIRGSIVWWLALPLRLLEQGLRAAARDWRRPLKRVLRDKRTKRDRPRVDGGRRGLRQLADVPIERAAEGEYETDVGPPAGVWRPDLPQVHDRPVAIVIPVFNAYQDVRRCLDHVRRHTPARHPVIVIDDASSDPHIAPLLAEFAETVGVQVVTHAANQGYTSTINEGIALAADADIVLLNSDTIVAQHWVRHLQAAAYATAEVGTVTAVSDNAGAFSVPRMGEANEPPSWLAEEDVAPMLARMPWRRYPTAPTGSGFCLYLRRDLIEAIGPFDAEAFPRGYGEENDFCMRALLRGRLNLVCPPTYVRHARSASFGAEKEALLKRSRALIDQRYPNYGALVREFTGTDATMRLVGSAVDRAGRDLTRRPRVRILFVLSTTTGGTPRTNFDLMDGLAWRYETLLLRCDRSTVTLYRYERGTLHLLEEHALQPAVSLPSHDSAAYQQVVRGLLARYDIGLVHIRHIAWHGLSLPAICRALDIPSVFSFHDYYALCPSVTLLDTQWRFHEPEDDGGAPRQSPLWPGNVMAETREGRHAWRSMMAAALEPCSAFVTTSRDARDRLLRGLPSLHGRRFDTIEHGRDFPDCVPYPVVPSQPLRVLVLGDYQRHKGSGLIEAVLDLDVHGLVEFHVFGKGARDRARPGLVAHPTYRREGIAELAAKIRPQIAAVLSIWPETYSHTLTESWAIGLPVLATDLGAVGERLAAHGGGWLVPAAPEPILRELTRIAGTPAEVEERALQVHAWQRRHCGTPEVARMAEAYDEIYTGLLDARPRPAAAIELPGRLRIGLLLKERRPGAFYATAHVRLLGWLRHPSIASSVELTLLPKHRLEEAKLAGLDLVIAQRDALSEAEAECSLARCAELKVPFVYEIDDDLLAVPPAIDADGAYRGARGAIELQLRRATAIVTSTEQLATQLRSINPHVMVHENGIDEFHLLSRTGPTPAVVADAAPGATIDCLFMGSRSHADDMAFLDLALDRALAREPRLRFVTIGCRPPSSKWQALPVPAELDYPDFCAWLRDTAPRFAFGVAPLLDTLFNRGKSGLKFLEYAAIGLPGAFSSVGSFLDVVEHGHTGLLVENTAAAWADAIVTLAQDAGLRGRLARAAHATIIRDHTIRGRARAYLTMLEAVAASTAITGRT